MEYGACIFLIKANIFNDLTMTDGVCDCFVQPKNNSNIPAASENLICLGSLVDDLFKPDGTGRKTVSTQAEVQISMIHF